MIIAPPPQVAQIWSKSGKTGPVWPQTRGRDSADIGTSSAKSSPSFAHIGRCWCSIGKCRPEFHRRMPPPTQLWPKFVELSPSLAVSGPKQASRPESEPELWNVVKIRAPGAHARKNFRLHRLRAGHGRHMRTTSCRELPPKARPTSSPHTSRCARLSA